MFEKINVTRILTAHIGTFEDYATKKSKALDFACLAASRLRLSVSPLTGISAST